MTFHRAISIAFSAALLCVVNVRASNTHAPAPEQQVTAGPVHVALKLDKAELNAADSLGAVLTVRAPVGVRLTLPPVETRLGEFSVVSAVDEPLRTAIAAGETQQVATRRYTLEPFLPGQYSIPPLEVRWQRGTDAGVARTAEVKVTVTSLLPPPDKSGKQPDPGTIRDSYTKPEPSDRRVVLVGLTAAAVGLAGGAWWVRNRRQRQPDVLGALEQRIRSLRESLSASGPSPDALHELAANLRTVLDTASPGAAVCSGIELREQLRASPSPIHEEMKRAADALSDLDAARFGGAPLSAGDIDRISTCALSLLSKIRALPRPGGAP